MMGLTISHAAAVPKIERCYQMDILNLITNIGFPIACVIVMGYYIRENQKENRIRFDELNNRFIELQRDTITAIQNNTNAVETLHDLIMLDKSDIENEKKEGIK